VINTAIGALSNISLDQELKRYVGSTRNIKSVLKILRKNINDAAIACTGAGLLANLAVSDNIADVLVENDAVMIITKMLNNDNLDSTFQRNSAAALSNVITSREFITECLKHKTIEALFHLQHNATTMGVVALIMNCFNTLQVDGDFYTTSYHMMIHHRQTDLFKTSVLSELRMNKFFNIDEQDANGLSVIDLASQQNLPHIVTFLIQCGADYSVLSGDNVPVEIVRSINVAEQEMRFAKNFLKTVITKSVKNIKLPADLSLIIAEFVPSIEILAGAGLIKF
jgi:hypothetical protein